MPRSALSSALSRIDRALDSERMGALVILALLGLVAAGLIGWLIYHVRREALRRRQVTRVRAQVERSLTVDELRRRCGADSLPCYPGPSRKGASAA